MCLRLGRLQTAHGTRVTHRRDARLEAGRVQFGHRGARSQPGFECLTAHPSAEPIFGFINECGLVSDGAPFAHPACRVCGIGFVSFNKFSSGKNLNCQCEPVTESPSKHPATGRERGKAGQSVFTAGKKGRRGAKVKPRRGTTEGKTHTHLTLTQYRACALLSGLSVRLVRRDVQAVLVPDEALGALELEAFLWGRGRQRRGQG